MLVVLTMLLLGVAAGRWRWLPPASSSVLEAFAIRFALPALVITTVPRMSADASLLVPMIVGPSMVVAMVLATWGVSRLCGFDRRTMLTLLLVVPLSNNSFMGYPAVEALLGAEHLAPAIVYDQFGSFLPLTTYGLWLTAIAAGDPSNLRRDIFRRLSRFPPFLALLVAVALIPVGVPSFLDQLLSPLAATVTPVAMFAIGLRTTVSLSGWSSPPLLLGLILRLAVAPALLLLVAREVGVDGAPWDASVLQAAMPPMVLAGLLAAEADLDADLASKLVGGGIVVSMGTLPLWGAWLGS